MKGAKKVSAAIDSGTTIVIRPLKRARASLSTLPSRVASVAEPDRVHSTLSVSDSETSGN
jgi:hypothetical protein